MKDINPLFAGALFESERRVTEVSIWTLAHAGGVFRFVNMDHAVTIDLGDGSGSNRYEPLPFRRGTLEAQSDLQVDKLPIEMPNAELLINYTLSSERTTLGDLVLNGVLDHATVAIWLVNLENLGAMRHSNWEVVATSHIDRSVVGLELHSLMGRGLRKCPRTVMQEQCANGLFDGICGLVRAVWTVGGAATGGNRLSMTTALAQPAGWFDLGQVTFTGGPNVGAVRTVSEFLAGGAFVWSVPLRFAVVAGDVFNVVPGCNKTTDQCQTKFANLNQYRGFPNIPRPEMIA